MASDLLGVSITGLRVSQASLSTTGNNISNAGVEGYSRQRVEITTNPSTLKGEGYIGNGANVESIERVVNDFVIEQLRTDTALYSSLEAYHSNVSQLDNLLSDVDTGLSGALESFFSSMQNGADDPTSIPARQLIISESENLADRFNTIYSRLENIEDGIDESLKSAIAQVNALADDLSAINRKVADSYGAGDNASPNDLLDQRDEALRQLSELVNVQTYDQGNGQINVVVGSGQNLVIGNESRQLNLAPSAEDTTKYDVVFQDSNRNQVITDNISGGQIGGLIDFRDQVMDDTYNELGRIALVLADTFNQAHQQGITLNDTYGRNFFYDVNDTNVARNRVVANSANPAPDDRVLSLNITDSSVLTSSDYTVEIEGGGLYKVKRESDGEQVASGLLPGSFPFAVEFDGLELEFEAGSFQNGDAFTLRPFKSAARDFSSSITDPSQIAFGAPLSNEASLGNTGTGAISAGEILSLTDINGDALPLLKNVGELNPPLVVRFTSETTYDVLDNSDPGNPVQLVPPIRNQIYIPGTDNYLFSDDPGETIISAEGAMLGLAEGREPVSQAALVMAAPTAVPPGYTTTNFGATANRFSFDVVVTNTLNAERNGTFQVTIAGPAIGNDDALLNEINSQLSGSDVTAYISDDGTLAFHLNTAGYGNITLENYNNDPDGNGDTLTAGVANNLLGFDIEGSTFTTVGNVNGVAGDGALTNGYPAEVISITTESTDGRAAQTQNIYTNLNASAKEIAGVLDNIFGVSANAFNYVELSNYQVTGNTPLQFTLNGEPLLAYEPDPTTGDPVLSSDVPDPQTDINAFNDYVANAINENNSFQSSGIYAVSAANSVTGNAELRIYASHGDDLQVGLIAGAGETLDISDGANPNVTLEGSGSGVSSSIVVGGQLDVTMAEGISLETFPGDSMLFGDSSAPDFAQSTYMGIQVSIGGDPDAGDDFTIDFNRNGALDNRNALRLVNLQKASTVEGAASYSEGYGSLVEKVGIDTSAAKINLDASENVLEQTTKMRDSVSAVNLDEEAANLIRFEQMYSANAQVISVARDLFDTLISAF